MAGSPGGQVIGRVSVKVLPDTSEFSKHKLERQLSREIKNAQVKVKVEVEIDKTSLDKIKHDLNHWARKVSPVKIHVKPELATGALTYINARMAYASRTRMAPIIAYLQPGSIAAVNKGIGTMVAALSGARVIKEVVTDFGDWLKTLDKTAPKLGIIAHGLTGIVGLGLTAGSNLFALSSSLAQIGAVGLALPGILAGIGVGLAVTMIAFKDLKKALPDVAARFAEMKHTITRDFWSAASNGIRQLVDVYLPQLGATAKHVGGFWGKFASELSKPFKSALPAMFSDLNASIKIAGDNSNVFAGVITKLGLAGSNYLPRLAQWFVDINTRFNNWLGAIATDGRLTKWVEGGLTALHDLGSVLSNLGGLLAGISRAATNAGGSGLGLMAQTLERINNAVNTPAFQTGLTATLMAAHQAMSLISTTSGPAVSAFFSQLGTTLTALLPIAGQAIGTLVSALATALANPAFVNGFTALIDGVGQAIKGLAPAMTPIAGMLGTLGAVMGTFLASMGPVLGDILTTLSGAFQSLLPALQPLIGFLTGALGTAFASLAPVIMQLGQSIGSLITGGVLPMLVTAFSALLPVINALAPVIANVLGAAFSALAPILPVIGSAIAQIAPLFGQLLIALLPLVSALLPALASILAAIIPVIVTVAQAVLPPLIAAVTALVSALVPVIDVIAQVVTWLVGQLAPVLTFVAGLLAGVVSSLLNGFTNVFEGVMNIWEGFKTMFSGGWSNFFIGIGQVLTGLWQVIIGVIEAALNIGILGAIKKAFVAFKAVFELGWAAIRGGASQAFALLRWSWDMFLTGLKQAPSKVLSEIKLLFTNAMTSIRIGAQAAWSNVTAAFSGGVNRAISFLRGLPGQASSALSNIGSTLINAGRSLITGFIDGIKGAVGGVKNTLQDLTQKLKDWKGPESLDRVLLVNAGQLIIDGLIRGMESRYDGVRRSLQGLTSDIGSTSIVAPQIADLSGSYASVSSSLAGGAGAAQTAAPTYEINVPMMPTNSSPEDVADAILHAQKRIAYGSAYAT